MAIRQVLGFAVQPAVRLNSQGHLGWASLCADQEKGWPAFGFLIISPALGSVIMRRNVLNGRPTPLAGRIEDTVLSVCRIVC